MLTNNPLSDSGIITPSLALGSFNSYFGNPDAPLRGAIVSVYQAGGMCYHPFLHPLPGPELFSRGILTRDLAWLGSASVGVTSDRMGRRKAIAFGCAWGVLGGALMAGAAHVAMRECSRALSWLIARFVGAGELTPVGG